MSGGVRRIFVDGGIQVSQAQFLIGFKANLDRGGFISDIYMRGLVAGGVDSCLDFTNNYHGARGGNFPTLFSNITIEGLSQRPISNVTLNGFTVDKAPSATHISGT